MTRTGLEAARGRRRGTRGRTVLIAMVVAIATAGLVVPGLATPVAMAAAGEATLAPGQVLKTGQMLQSSNNGQYRLIMQRDGNLVLYAAARQALWASRTSGGIDRRLVMQGDGNLVIYGAGRALWASATAGHPGADVTLHDDGNLLLSAASGQPLWATGTRATSLPPGGTLRTSHYLQSPDWGMIYSLVMQVDGNLVLYDGVVALWATRTTGGADRKAVMQRDGNFVVYNSAGRALWASRTYGHPGAYLVLQDDGNLVIYATSGRPLWATGTAYVLRP